MIIREPELVRRLAKDTRLSQRVVSDVVAAFQRQVQDSLRDGHTVELTGFGAFHTGERQEREVRRFRREGGELVRDAAGKPLLEEEPTSVPAHRYAAFRVGDVLKRAVKRQSKRRWGLLGRSPSSKATG
jgi:nucleoid DNA-binding protein